MNIMLQQDNLFQTREQDKADLHISKQNKNRLKKLSAHWVRSELSMLMVEIHSYNCGSRATLGDFFFASVFLNFIFQFLFSPVLEKSASEVSLGQTLAVATLMKHLLGTSVTKLKDCFLAALFQQQYFCYLTSKTDKATLFSSNMKGYFEVKPSKMNLVIFH